MNFHVYRRSNSGWTQLGTTKYIEDAKAILERWHSGYIVTNNGEMVFRKGM